MWSGKVEVKKWVSDQTTESKTERKSLNAVVCSYTVMKTTYSYPRV